MIRVIAHRGASAEFPENTLIACDAALDQGSDAIELDLQLTRDDVPVVYHDAIVVCAGGGRRRVTTLTLAELRRIDLGARFGERFRGQRIPTLEQVLERYARRTELLLELKTYGSRPEALVSRTIATVQEAGSPVGVSLLCFDSDVLELCARLAPSLPRVLNLGPRSTPLANEDPRLAGLAALSVDVRILDAQLAVRERAAQLPLLVFTCNSPASLARARDAGAAGVMTDRPDWLRGLLCA